MVKNHSISRTAFEQQQANMDLTRKAFLDLWDGEQFVGLRQMLGGREQAVAQMICWKIYRQALNGHRQN